MLNLKVQFEEVTSERNKIGLQLIERNDELTVLHEKSHQQIESLKKGEMELLKRMNEIMQETAQPVQPSPSPTLSNILEATPLY